MDEVCLAVLGKVGSVGAYKIISEDEFFENFPDDAEKSEAELSRALKTLRSDGYIDVKYSSGTMYCVAALKQPPEQQECTEEPEIFQPTEIKVRALPAFLAAFFGGAAGSLIISLLFAFL